MSDELMPIYVYEGSDNVPVLCVCYELDIPLTNKTFLKSVISYYSNDMLFKFNSLSFGKFSFKSKDDTYTVLALYIQNDFVGYVSTLSLVDCCKQALQIVET